MAGSAEARRPKWRVEQSAAYLVALLVLVTAGRATAHLRLVCTLDRRQHAVFGALLARAATHHGGGSSGAGCVRGRGCERGERRGARPVGGRMAEGGVVADGFGDGVGNGRSELLELERRRWTRSSRARDFCRGPPTTVVIGCEARRLATHTRQTTSDCSQPCCPSAVYLSLTLAATQSWCSLDRLSSAASQPRLRCEFCPPLLRRCCRRSSLAFFKRPTTSCDGCSLPTGSVVNA